LLLGAAGVDGGLDGLFLRAAFNSVTHLDDIIIIICCCCCWFISNTMMLLEEFARL
jgi:hypothetical protein